MSTEPTYSGHLYGVESLSFSLNGTTLASASPTGGTVKLWDIERGNAVDLGHTSIAKSLSFSPDGTTLASGAWDHTVKLWDIATGTNIDSLSGGHRSFVRFVSFSPNGKTLASLAEREIIKLWDVTTGQNITIFKGYPSWVTCVSFSPDGTILAAGIRNGTVRLWDVATETNITTLKGHTDFVSSISFSPDGTTCASSSYDNTFKLWDVVTGQNTATFEHEGRVESVEFSPDGTILASSSWGTIKLWDMTTGIDIATLTHKYIVRSMVFSPDGVILASGGDSNERIIRLWDVTTGENIAILEGHTSGINSLSFSPDGKTLASGASGTILLWDIETLKREFGLSIPIGISLIHVPLKVEVVDGVAQTIKSVSDLYDVLGGTDAVNALVTYDNNRQEWVGYSSPQDRGTFADKSLTDDKGIIAIMSNTITVRLQGFPLGINGRSSITLHPGINLVGIPLRDSRIIRISDLFTIRGIQDNVGPIILSDDGEFKVVGRAGDDGDIPIVGGQSFILNARTRADVTIYGGGWYNAPRAQAAPLMTVTGIEVGNTTPVMVLRGSIVDEGTGVNKTGFRVVAKNLSTGKVVATMIKSEGPSYQLIFVDIETARAAQIGDILEISAQSTDSFINIQSLQYTITAEDVKRSRVELDNLIAYEIPAETELLANYPNPFNPETWIPYRLAEDANVMLTIYDVDGRMVQQIKVGQRTTGVYENRNKAIYWNGRNETGERVASGIYFYHLSAGKYSATRRMVILK